MMQTVQTMKQSITQLPTKRSKGFFQLCIFLLIGIMGIGISIQLLQIEHILVEIEMIRKWME